MNEQIIAIFCICDDGVKSIGYPDDPQHKMTTMEIMTFVLISAMHYHADYRTAHLVSMSFRYFSRFAKMKSLASAQKYASALLESA